MSVTEEPVITTNHKGEDYTQITFYPDLTKFKMESMDSDICALMTKRAYDLAGVTDRKIKVILNGKKIEIKDFTDYCDLYLKNDENKELPKIIEKKNDRWEILASTSDGEF
jgi:DNA topoisomerase II